MQTSYNARTTHSIKPNARRLPQGLSLALLALLLAVALSISGCSGDIGSGRSVTPVQISGNCEAILQPVPPYPVVRGRTDSNVAYRGQTARLGEANTRIVNGRECQVLQREQYGNPFPVPRR